MSPVMSRPISHDHPDFVSDESPPKPRKNIVLATVLNAVLPGAGFAYLRRWKWAIINFVVVQTIIVGAVLTNEPTMVEHIHWIVLVLAVGSGSLAHTAARLQESQY